MAIDPAVQRIIDQSLAGDGMSKSELLHLFKVTPDSEEFAAMLAALRTIQETHRKAAMIAQIGVDSQPCPGNCFHCSFSARFNTRTPDQWFLSDEEVCSYAEDFVRRGANAIDLMVTAAFDFERLIELLHAVRERIGEDMPIMMNMGDFNLKQAERMREAGVTSIFHAVRMGEGLVTDIPLERRFETYAAANEVGFKIGASIENVTPMFTDASIARMMMRFREEVRPQSCGCSSKRLVEGTAGYAEPDFPEERMKVYQTAFRLLMNGICTYVGGTMYPEVGRNPRDWSLYTEEDGLIKRRGTSIEGFFVSMRAEGYVFPDGPSKDW